MRSSSVGKFDRLIALLKGFLGEFRSKSIGLRVLTPRRLIYPTTLWIVLLVCGFQLFALPPHPEINLGHDDNHYNLEECLVRVSFYPLRRPEVDRKFQTKSLAMRKLWAIKKEIRLPVVGIVFAETRHPKTYLQNITVAYASHCNDRLFMTRQLVAAYAREEPEGLLLEVGSEDVEVETSGLNHTIPSWANTGPDRGPD